MRADLPAVAWSPARRFPALCFMRPAVRLGEAEPKHLPKVDWRRHSALVRCLPLLVLSVTLGCGSEPLRLPKRPPLQVEGILSTPTRPTGTLYRDEVVSAVAAGLGYFLRLVDLRPVTQADDTGRRAFAGFEILSMRPALQWLAFDLAPGDIVTKIDGVSVEHYDSVIPLFEGLVAKDRFEVALMRAGQPRLLVVSIVTRQASPTSKRVVGK